jgi:hypothetical protein
VTKKKSEPGFAPGWCVEFRSMAAHALCHAGVDYTALNGGSEYRRMHQLPCFIKAGEKPGLRISCEHFKAPTAEEVAAHEQWLEGRRQLVITVKAAISDWRVQHSGRNIAGIVACPACGGQLHLSIKAHNDHVQGKCATNGCVSWTE